jgi:hypothetical protein
MMNIYNLKSHTMNTRPVITKCAIGPYPRPLPEGMFDDMPQVRVTFNDGGETSLFEFYPDEISFNESELIGLTENEAYALKIHKDTVYLQS